jgi:hypothetical protein
VGWLLGGFLLALGTVSCIRVAVDDWIDGATCLRELLRVARAFELL